MSLPTKLKNLNLFNEGHMYLGEASEVTLPKLSRKMEGYRGGGMDGEAQIDMGQEAIEFTWKIGGDSSLPYLQFGDPRANAHLLRFMGAYQNDATGEVKAIDISVRGRHQEVDPGTAKTGDGGETTVKTVCTYYKRMVNGVTEVEIDILNFVFIVNGKDMLAAQRAAVGI